MTWWNGSKRMFKNELNILSFYPVRWTYNNNRKDLNVQSTAKCSPDQIRFWSTRDLFLLLKGSYRLGIRDVWYSTSMDKMNSRKTYPVTRVIEQLTVLANKKFLRLWSQGSHLGLKKKMAEKAVYIGCGSAAIWIQGIASLCVEEFYLYSFILIE